MKIIIALLLSSLLLLAACQQPLEQPQQIDENQKTAAQVSDAVGIETRMVTYGNDFQGFLANPTAQGTYPGIVLIHEWWGLNDYIKGEAERLAKSGYVVLAVDLYDGKVGQNADEARQYSGKVRNDTTRSIAHMKNAVSYLKEQNGVNADKIASMGWCFGGGMSMQLALQDELQATVIYYGNLETDKEKLSHITWPILGIFGEEDTAIPVTSARKFGAALDDLGIENEIYIYPAVGHAFANPSNPGHDINKTADAWLKTVAFLDEHLKD